MLERTSARDDKETSEESGESEISCICYLRECVCGCRRQPKNVVDAQLALGVRIAQEEVFGPYVFNGRVLGHQ